MAKAAWQGFLAIGQIGVPVKLFSALRTTGPDFVLLHGADGSPVQRVLRCQHEKRDISNRDTIKAVKQGDGSYITLTEHELEHISSLPVKSIVIAQFCLDNTIDPMYFDKPFFVVAEPGGERAYALLREVMSRTGKVALTRYVYYNRERIGLLRVQADLLVLQQLRFNDNLLPRSEIKTPALPKPSPSEIDALCAIVERYSGPLFIEDYHDSYNDRIQSLIDRKAKGLRSPKRQTLISASFDDNQDLIAALEQTLHESQVTAQGDTVRHG